MNRSSGSWVSYPVACLHASCWLKFTSLHSILSQQSISPLATIILKGFKFSSAWNSYSWKPKHLTKPKVMRWVYYTPCPLNTPTHTAIVRDHTTACFLPCNQQKIARTVAQKLARNAMLNLSLGLYSDCLVCPAENGNNTDYMVPLLPSTEPTCPTTDFLDRVQLCSGKDLDCNACC